MKADRLRHHKKYSSLAAMLSLLLLVSLCTLTPFSISFLPHQHYYSAVTRRQAPRIRDHLEEALQRVSMTGSKTLIITIINRAYVEPVNGESRSMLDLFLEGFWEGEGTTPLLNRLLVVALDRTAYQRCVFRRLHCYRLRTAGGGGDDYSSEKLYLSEGFVRMMWRRTLFLTDVLERGYNFIFTDTDIMWLRNPFKRLSTNMSYDMQISTDAFNGDPWSEHNPINTGFYYVQSNNKTIRMFKTWYKLRESKVKEQDVLARMSRKGLLAEMGLVVRCLDVLYFSGFCSDSNDVSVVSTVHANCCKTIRAKVDDLRNVLRDWKTYRNMSTSINFKWTEHVACKNSWKTSCNTTKTMHCM